MIKACIFDLDGTLLNTITTISYYVNKTLDEFGYPVINEERYKILVGNGAKLLIERAIREVGGNMDDFDGMFEFYNKAYNKDTAYLTTPYSGIPELLAELKVRGIKTAILSNKPDFATKDAAKTFLGDMIDITLGATDDIPLKPSAEGVEFLLDELGVKKEECVYIGDTSVDMQTGKNAGIYTIGVLWGFRDRKELEESGADVIVSKPLEILNIIEAL